MIRIVTILLLLASGVRAGAEELRGRVSDASGAAVHGATLHWLGTATGTATDSLGRYTLQRPGGADTLVASCVGFRSDTLPVAAGASRLDVVLHGVEMQQVEVVARRVGIAKSRMDVTNTDRISSTELLRAACCNLGESFETNPSVDVSYSDASTGARQIKLLGLAGSYVQMLSENIPNLRGVASPYGLGYTPGTWMESIQVSKGAASVKNGYESLTGQINVEYKKPETGDRFSVNLFGNSMLRYEANADGTIRFSDRLSTVLLGHFEEDTREHDGNDDGYTDAPRVRQLHVMNKWAYNNGPYRMQVGLRALAEMRRAGQTEHAQVALADPYRVKLRSDRYELFTKQAWIFDAAHGSNLALILAGTLHEQRGEYGRKRYDVEQRTLYGSLFYERNFGPMHNLSLGTGWTYDSFDERYRLSHTASPLHGSFDKERVAGGYVQYTFNLRDRLVAMIGLRADHSSLHGSFFTPRIHLKYNAGEWLHVRASAGKGYRTVNLLAEYSYLLAGSRRILFNGAPYSSPAPVQEQAWNYGVSATAYVPLGQRTLTLNAEFYFTDFLRAVVADMDTDPHAIDFVAVRDGAFSRTWQVDATYAPLRGLNVTAAYRRTQVKSRIGGIMREKPLTARYKGLLTASYALQPLAKWQLDATVQFNGGGRMPDPDPSAPLWERRYPSFVQLNAQVTRFFRRGSIYAGGENLTGYRQKNPVVGAGDPWGPDFDSGMIWGPVQGAMFYIGVRFNIARETN